MNEVQALQQSIELIGFGLATAIGLAGALTVGAMARLSYLDRSTRKALAGIRECLDQLDGRITAMEAAAAGAFRRQDHRIDVLAASMDQVNVDLAEVESRVKLPAWAARN